MPSIEIFCIESGRPVFIDQNRYALTEHVEYFETNVGLPRYIEPNPRRGIERIRVVLVKFMCGR
jgi:hypothetical protein